MIDRDGMFLSDIKIVDKAPKHYIKMVRKSCLTSCWINNVIFVHIPKNAGTSIKKSLMLNKLPCHLFASEIKNIIGLKEFEDKAKFCVIRNPWDRLVSIYFQQCEKRRETRSFEGVDAIWAPGFEKGNPTFEDFVMNYYPKTWWQRRAVSQTKYIQHHNKDEIVVDKILRYENLNEEWMQFSREFNLNTKLFGKDTNILKMLNKSKKKKGFYRKFYKNGKKGFNNKLIYKVSELMSVDIENFGYKF